MENQLLKSYRKTAIKWGINTGLASIVFTLLIYVLNAKLMASFTWMSLSLVLCILFMVLAVKEVKKNQGGFISLSEALFCGFFVYAIGALISGVFSYVLMTWIDPNLPLLIREVSIEKTVEMMNKFGASEEDISKALDNINEQPTAVSIKSSLIGFIASSALGFVIAFILAAILRKKQPVFEQ